jgi:hypothetical protein
MCSIEWNSSRSEPVSETPMQAILEIRTDYMVQQLRMSENGVWLFLYALLQTISSIASK